MIDPIYSSQATLDLMKAVWFSVGIGSWHPAGVARLVATLKSFKWKHDIKTWIDEYPPNSNTHQVTPYHFKVMGFNWAKENGYDIVIYSDASFWCQKDPEQLVEMIKEDGHLMIRNGWTLGEWCADSALKPLGLTREESFGYPQLVGGLIGLDLRNETSRNFLMQWTDLAQASFPGAWTNDKKQCSNDDRVLGHRHDQTAASIISHRLGMKWRDATGILDYNWNNEDSIMLLRGM